MLPDPFAGAEGGAPEGGGEFDSESGVAEDSGEAPGVGIGDGSAGDVILSRASGICAASEVGVEGSIGSRYGSTSP